MNRLQVLLDYATLGALAAIYAIAAVLAGKVVSRVMRLRIANGAYPSVDMAALFMLGQGILGTLWQTAAAMGVLSPLVVAGVTLALLVWGGAAHWPIVRPAGALAALRRRFEDAPLSAMVLAVVVAGLMLQMAPLSLLPPGTDAMAFYISQPKLIAATGSFTPLAGYDFFAQLSLASEMHYAAFFILGGAHVGGLSGKLFIWVIGAASLILTWGIALRAGLAPTARWLVPLLGLTSSAFSLILWDGKTDLIPNGLALLAVYLLLAQPLTKADLAAAGLATGLACISKLSFIASFGVSIAALLAWRLYRDENRGATHIWRHFAVAGIIFGCTAALPVLALSLKNTLVFSEPLAPFYLFGDAKPFPLDQVWFSPENTRWIVATYPLALVFGQYPMQHGNLSALMLAALPLPLLAAVRSRLPAPAVALAIAGLGGVLAWVVLRPSVLAPRYILPSLLLLAPVLAAAVIAFWEQGGRWARSIVATSLSVMVIVTAYDTRSTIRLNREYLVGLPRQWSHPIWRAADVVNTSTRPEARVFNLMYYSSMYRSDVLACMVAPTADVLHRMSATMPEFWQALHARGITHVVYDKLTHERILKSRLDPELAPKWLDVVEKGITDRFRTYELFARSGAPVVASTCESERKAKAETR